MIRIAYRMLVQDRAKFLALVLGIAFAAILIAQQAGMGWSAVMLSSNQIRDVREADIWVMKPNVEHIDGADPLPDSALSRVRSVEGVAWAVPYYTGIGMLRSTTGLYKAVNLYGIDEQTLTGAPRDFVLGGLSALHEDGAVLVDIAGYIKLFPGVELRLGDEFEIGQQRGKVVGIFRSLANFSGQPMVVTKRMAALRMARESLNSMTYVLVRTQPGEDPGEVARRISKRTGLLALTSDQFVVRTVTWVAKNSGIIENFMVTVILGFVVGVAIVGQTFYMFSTENMKQFAALKAIGVSNRSIVGMVLLQATYVSFLGYGIGIGVTALIFYSMTVDDGSALRGLYLPDPVAFASGGLVLILVLMSSMVSAWKVLTVDPALVFRS